MRGSGQFRRLRIRNFPNSDAGTISFLRPVTTLPGEAAAPSIERKPMAQKTPEACQTGLNASLPDAGGTAFLNDRDFIRLAPALDFSTEEWLLVFDAHCGLPSERREIFRETVEEQLVWISWCADEDDPCPESLELSNRIEALPRILKLTVLEAIERFWTSKGVASSWDEHLRHLGLRPCACSHARLAALAHRRHVLPEQKDCRA